eukprot:GHVQ01013798.1.p1 GENE.GHVQ01013798.1~~GHVQ01013798.1.p1  ORF type:complete len:344 (-),score=16.71 GHVQ01013798.1:758-1789(-)
MPSVREQILGRGSVGYDRVVLPSQGSDDAPGEMGYVQLYKVWKGNNTFFCKGGCATGPQPQNLIFTICLLAIPLMIFSFYILPEACTWASIWLIVPFITLLPAVFYYLIRSALTEPGILPRRYPLPDEVPNDGANATRDIMINGVVVSCKWCVTCKLFRPPRSKHCVYCDNCVQRFDHHCPWVSNCVGLRNYRYFVGFVISTTLLTIYVMVIDGLVILTKAYQAEQIIRGVSPEALVTTVVANPMLTFMFLFLCCVFCPLLNLSLFHCYLIARNLTTNEEIKELYHDRNPFSLGLIGNCREALSANKEPSGGVWYRFQKIKISLNVALMTTKEKMLFDKWAEF